MKIGKKLIISNVIITAIAMIVLGILIRIIMISYITDNIKADLINQNRTISRFIRLETETNKLHKRFEGIAATLKPSKRIPFISFIFYEEAGNIFSLGEFALSEKDIKQLYFLNDEKINRLKIYNKESIIYCESVNVAGQTLKIATMVFNNDINRISWKIMVVVIFAIICVSIIILFTTRISERMITNPIKLLINSAGEIGKKNFDSKVVINTNDEFKILGDAINDMCQSLKRKDIEQKTLYENVSHELKTPLTVIRGYAEGIKSDIIKDKDEALDIIIRQCIELKKQVEDSIYLSKLDSVNEVLNLEIVSLNLLVIEGLNKLESLFIMNEVDIIFEPKEEILVKVDKEKIIRVITNIISNCIKYTLDEITISIYSENENIVLEIKDNGKGFKDEILNSPYIRFMVGEKEGTGIGLCIVKKIMDTHEAKIKLSNNVDGGACYTLYFKNNS